MRRTAAAAVALAFASLAAADAPEPGCEEQATSPTPIAREPYAIEGEMLEMPNISRLSFF